MFKKLMKMKVDHQLLIVVAVFVILFALFWPRDRPLASINFGANLGNLGGKISLEALESLDEGFEGKTLAFFYAPWCGHCQKAEPEWEKAEKMNNTDVKLVKINCDENKELAEKYGIQGFPTFYFLPHGLNNPKDRVEYKGDRTGEALLSFIKGV